MSVKQKQWNGQVTKKHKSLVCHFIRPQRIPGLTLYLSDDKWQKSGQQHLFTDFLIYITNSIIKFKSCSTQSSVYSEITFINVNYSRYFVYWFCVSQGNIMNTYIRDLPVLPIHSAARTEPFYRTVISDTSTLTFQGLNCQQVYLLGKSVSQHYIVSHFLEFDIHKYLGSA